MTMNRSFFLIASFMLLLVLCNGAAGADETGAGEDSALLVTVREDVAVSGEQILLGQISSISGGSRSLRQAVRDICLGPAPRPGQTRRITGNSVAVALANVAGTGGRSVIPAQIQVRGAFQHIPEASLEEAFKQYVLGAVGEDEVAISQIDIRGDKPIPPGDITLTPLSTTRGEVKGKTSLRLSVKVDGEDCGRVTVSGWVDRYAQVVCSARPVPRNSILTAEDLCLERVNIAKAPSRLVYDMADAVGKRTRSSLQTGKYLQPQKLSDVLLVEKGDRVKLQVSTGLVNISTLGVAKSGGGAGDQIRVENISTEKTVIGRVVDDAIVEVLF